MRKYIKKTETISRDVLDETTCDLCGKIATDGLWESSVYDVNEVEIEVKVKHRDGSSYPEGGWGTSYIVDMCPDCFKGKLIPWLESQGCKAKRKDWDW